MPFTWYLASQNSCVLELIKKLNIIAVTLVKNYKGRRKHQLKYCIVHHIPKSFILAEACSSAHCCNEGLAPFALKQAGFSFSFHHREVKSPLVKLVSRPGISLE